ncbi:hypothetical protein MRX96_021969 [Rhipicephalus microplus]
MTTHQKGAAVAKGGMSLPNNLQLLQQQRVRRNAAPATYWSIEACLDRKIKKDLSVSLTRLAAMATAHNIYALLTCTSFLPDSLRPSGSFVPEWQRAPIFLDSAVDVDGGALAPQYDSLHGGYDVDVTQQLPESSNLLELDVKHVVNEEDCTKELHAGTLVNNGVATLRSTRTEGRTSGRWVDVALVDHHSAVPGPEANYGASSITDTPQRASF